MKHKTSVALDEETIMKMRELVRSGLFRNKSHIMDYAISKLVFEKGRCAEAPRMPELRKNLWL